MKKYFGSDFFLRQDNIYEDGDLRIRLRGGVVKVNLRRSLESAPMASKIAGSREEKYIFHLKKKSSKKNNFFSSNLCLEFFSHDF